MRYKVRELYREGYPLRNIAEHCNLQRSDVEVIIKEFGFYI